MYLAVLKQAWFNAVNTRRLFVMVFLSQFVGMCFALVKPVFENTIAYKLGGSLKSEAKEKGLNISGDEKQRLALARGILATKNSKLILLDEPTSSIDVNNENDIYDAIFTEFKNKTIISAAHHLNLVDKFDYIYVFADGCIVEHGTPAALKYRQSLFADMLKKYIYQSKV